MFEAASMRMFSIVGRSDDEGYYRSEQEDDMTDYEDINMLSDSELNIATDLVRGEPGAKLMAEELSGDGNEMREEARRREAKEKAFHEARSRAE